MNTDDCEILPKSLRKPINMFISSEAILVEMNNVIGISQIF